MDRKLGDIMYRLIINNQDIIKDCNNPTWGGDTDNLGVQLTFDSIKEIPTGTVVQLFNDNNEIFRGIALEPQQNRWTWNYMCQDYSHYLKNNKIPIKQFYNMRADDAINSLASESYLTTNIVNIPTLISHTYTNTSSDKIIDDILTQAKTDQGIEYFKEIEGDILYIRQLTDMQINPALIMPKEVNIKQSMTNMKNKITVISGNDDNAQIQATSEDTSQQGFYGVLSDVLTVDDKNISQAQNMADNALSTSNKIEYSCTLTDIVVLKDADLIKPNRMIYLHAGSRLDGYYKIKNVSHKLDKSLQHKVTINIVW